MKRLPVALLALTLTPMAFADTIVGKMVDPTTPSAAYVPTYQAQCQVDGVGVYEDLNLAAPEFTALSITVPAGATLRCRMNNTNTVVPSYPIEGNYTAWYSPTEATNPADLTSPVFIIVK